MKVTKAVMTLMILIFCVSVSAFSEEKLPENQMTVEKRLVRVAGDPFPPWTIGSAGSKPTGGIAVEIVEELFRRLNLKTRVVIYPLKRGLQRIKEGDEDVVLMVSKSKEREEYMLFTHSIRYARFVFYYPAKLKNFEWHEWKDLQPYMIGSVTGYNYGQEWKDAVKKYNLKVEEVKTDNFNIDKVLLGRIDIILGDSENMQEIIQQNPKYHGKLKWHKKPVFESVNNFGVSKKSFLAPMMPKINEVLQEMKDDGTFRKIFCAHKKSFRGSCE
jgi:polar amino acid transport system substrate-binding protein